MKVITCRIWAICLLTVVLVTLSACTGKDKVDPYTQFDIQFVETTGYREDGQTVLYNNALIVKSVGEYPVRLEISCYFNYIHPTNKSHRFMDTDFVEVGIGETVYHTYDNRYVFMTDEFSIEEVTVLDKPPKAINLTVMVISTLVIVSILLLAWIMFSDESGLIGPLPIVAFAITYIITLAIMGIIEAIASDPVTFVIFGERYF